MTTPGGQGWGAPSPLAGGHAGDGPPPRRRGRVPGWLWVVLGSLVVATVVAGVVLVRTIGPRDDTDAPLALTTEVLEAVSARDADALDALVVDDADLPWVRPDSGVYQPRSTDLVVGDDGLAEALDLDVTWTPPESDTSVTGAGAEDVVQDVRTTLTYAYDVDGKRFTSTADVLFHWSGWEDSRRVPWRLEQVVVPDPDGFTSTFDPMPVTGEVTEPGAAEFGVGVCTANWIAMTQAFDVYGGPDEFPCFPDGSPPSAVDPALVAEAAKPYEQRRFAFEVQQTQLTQLGWSDTLPLSQWVLTLDDRDYLVAVARVADGSGRVVAAVPVA